MNIEDVDFTNTEILRKKAEEILKSKQIEESIAQKEANAERLLHELQVHQIELEMQNEELRQAYETAELTLKRYTMVFDLSPVGYFSLDEEGSICNLNFTGAEMLGERRFSLLSSKFILFVSDDSKTVFNDFFKRVYNSYSKELCEISLSINTNPLCSVYIEGVVTEDNQKCLLTVIDISRFRNKEI